MTKFVADLHLHSSYARATSRYLNFDTLSEWAKYKGIDLLSSADFTHPVWWGETKNKLKESKNPGFYEYKGLQFVLGSEISCIYTQGGRMRRMHCLLYFPEMRDVEEFNSRLGKRANLRADGRPIIGMSAKNLLELALEVNEKAIFIPAHAWTPWFSLYGSNSGFDSIEEAFGDLSKYVYAIETGLSSDPAMNWRIPELDTRSIVSFSDAHSMQKMSRELTIFESDFSYNGLLNALRGAQVSDQQFLSVPNPREIDNNKPPHQKSSLVPTEPQKLDQKPSPGISMTIEFFPEEGKYHFTGHRNCNVSQSPQDSNKDGIICPKCGRKLTVGVMHRVEELADKSRPEGFTPEGRPPFKSMVPLLEILAESMGKPVSSPAVLDEYKNLVKELGSEMNVLLEAEVTDLEKAASIHKIAGGIKKVREGDIVIDPGYDGVFGTVRIWDGEEAKKNANPPQPVKQADGQARLPGF